MAVVRTEYSKMVDIIIKTYISICTNQQLFVDKRMNPAYFMIRSALLKKNFTDIKTLFDYITTLKEKQIMSLADLFVQAEEYRRDRFVSREPILATNTERYSVEKLLSM